MLTTIEQLRVGGYVPTPHLEFRKIDGKHLLHQRWDHPPSGKMEWRVVPTAPDAATE